MCGVHIAQCGESLAQGCPNAIAHFRANGYGVVLVVPDGPEPMGLGREALRVTIEQAAGVDLLGKTQSSPNAG